MKKGNLIFLPMLLMGAGCRTSDAVISPIKSASEAADSCAEVLRSDEEYQARTDEFLVSGFEFLRATGTYLSREQIVRALGEPAHEVDNMMWFDYKTYGPNFYHCTMNIKMYASDDGSSTRDYIKAISMTSDKYVWRYGIKIGSRRDYIGKVLGEPYETQQEGEVWIYTHSEYTPKIYFKFKDDAINEIRWYFNPQ